VHRLDRETSGLMVFARTIQAESGLGKQFRKHTIERRYLAIVQGRLEASAAWRRAARIRSASTWPRPVIRCAARRSTRSSPAAP
jgi:23S rRNA-/tRNA-specific pseudouridylate synthase